MLFGNCRPVVQLEIHLLCKSWYGRVFCIVLMVLGVFFQQFVVFLWMSTDQRCRNDIICAETWIIASVTFWPMWHGLWELVPLSFCYSTSTQVSYHFHLFCSYSFQSRVMWLLFKLKLQWYFIFRYMLIELELINVMPKKVTGRILDGLLQFKLWRTPVGRKYQIFENKLQTILYILLVLQLHISVYTEGA